VFGEIAVSLNFREDAKQYQEFSAAIDVEVLILEQARFCGGDQFIDEIVDDDVLFDHLLGEFAVVGQERVGGRGDCLADQRKYAHRLGSQVLGRER
jgi:hypothetical protein